MRVRSFLSYTLQVSENSHKMNKINYFFKPRGVALIGASSNPNKLSNGVLVNMTQYGYRGKVYPVNPRSEEIQGLKCFPDISAVPDPVDLAVIMIPAPYVPDILEACGKKGGESSDHHLRRVQVGRRKRCFFRKKVSGNRTRVQHAHDWS